MKTVGQLLYDLSLLSPTEQIAVVTITRSEIEELAADLGIELDSGDVEIVMEDFEMCAPALTRLLLDFDSARRP
jgi:ethanolamine utilization microcompartment shell protein EutS